MGKTTKGRWRGEVCCGSALKFKQWEALATKVTLVRGSTFCSEKQVTSPEGHGRKKKPSLWLA
jgi:hypothetical protein